MLMLLGKLEHEHNPSKPVKSKTKLCHIFPFTFEKLTKSQMPNIYIPKSLSLHSHWAHSGNTEPAERSESQSVLLVIPVGDWISVSDSPTYNEHTLCSVSRRKKTRILIAFLTPSPRAPGKPLLYSEYKSKGLGKLEAERRLYHFIAAWSLQSLCYM